MPNFFSRVFLLAAFAAAPVLAQASDGAYWNEYPRPAGTTQVRGIGSIVLIETPTEYHFFSGQHRKWVVQPVTAPTLVGLANKQCLWRDGSSVFGYSSFTARVAELPVSPTAIVNIGSISSSWTSYVVDGNDVWAFSAFFGEWQHLACQTAPQMGINSHVVTAFEGGRAHAFSALFGQWVSLPTQGAGQVLTWRNGAFATFSGPDVVAAFSTYTNTWDTIGYPTTGLAIDSRDGFASLSPNGTDRLWFSALRGMFTVSSFPVGTVTTFGPAVATIQTPTGEVYGYAPGTGVVTPIPCAPNPLVAVAAGSFGSYALVDDGATLTGFSGLRGASAVAPGYAPSVLTLGDTAGFATGTNGEGFAYSAIRNEWAQSPNVPALAIAADFECILRTTPTGYQAYSARTGTFADLASTGTIVMLTQGSIIGIRDGSGVDVFDPRYSRWVRVNTGLNPTFGVHRLVGIGQDGTNAFGFSLWNYEWESIPMQGTFTAQNVNSSIAFLQTTSHVYVYSATGSLSTFGRFPEFSRFQVLGQPLQHNQLGNPGAFVVALLSLTDVELGTPYGVLRVDANPIALPLGFVPADGRLYSPIALPDVPALRGLTMFMQDVLLKTNGDIKLSNGLAHLLW
ncbi:MAG: hypothetical protein JNK15_11260 [Planctomycetes bacterium]|nr:hypothetical protein [Planctomycetota bacterium]